MQSTRVALATQHGKERQVAPAFADTLGWTIERAETDTDVWGTFAREVPRVLSPLNTALEKARSGARQLGLRAGVGSEGTIGPHPHIPFVTVDHEVLAFVDLAEGFEVVEHVLSTDTVAVSELWHENLLLDDIMERADLPHHALIVRTDTPSSPMVVKGITSREGLERAIHSIRSDDPGATIVLESDHRAMMSPSRQKVIRDCARKLVMRLAQYCPACATRGWGVVDLERGIPCRGCGTLSQDAISADVEGCVRCDYRVTVPREFSEVDPAQCQVCNP